MKQTKTQPATGSSVVSPANLNRASDNVLHRDDNTREGVRKWFQKFSQVAAAAMGSPWAFVIATLSIVVWAFSRRLFNTSDTWQLVINTSTTIITFLMVFLIQNTQNRDAKAIHLKLDELIRSKKGARNLMVDLENCTDEELDKIDEEFKRLRHRAATHDAKKNDA